jgi:hypothetical protein
VRAVHLRDSRHFPLLSEYDFFVVFYHGFITAPRAVRGGGQGRGGRRGRELGISARAAFRLWRRRHDTTRHGCPGAFHSRVCAHDVASHLKLMQRRGSTKIRTSAELLLGSLLVTTMRAKVRLRF